MILKMLGDTDQKIEKKVTEKVQEIFGEERERESRKLNVILYNVPESRAKGEEAKKEDERLIEGILEEIGAEDSGHSVISDIAEAARLGIQRDEPSRPRPIKLVLKNTDSKNKILRKAKNLRDSTQFQKVGISRDKTMQERTEEKALLEERYNRKKTGEDVIIYKGKVVPRSSVGKPANKEDSGADCPSSSQ